MLMRNKKVWIALVLVSLAGTGAYVIGLKLRSSYHLRAAERALERRDFRQASIHLKKCLDLQPGGLKARFLAGQTARRLGDHTDALRHLERYARQTGSKTDVKLEYTLLDIQMGNFEEADRMLSQCADSPEAPETSLILEAIVKISFESLPSPIPGDALPRGAEAHLARVKRCLELWGPLQRSQGDEVQGLVWRGQLHQYSNDYPQAQADFQQALERDPDHFQARLYLALMLSQEAPGKAATHLERLRRLDPENKSVLFALAFVRRCLGEFEEAGRILDEVLEANPDDVKALFERGKAALDAEQPREAEQWLRRALDLAPTLPHLNLVMSRCLRLLGKEAESKQYELLYEQQFREMNAEKSRQQHEPDQKDKRTPGG